jgi:Trk-type K+ transport system membrane component
MFTNLTIKPQPPLIVSSQSISYMGQVDANAPAPFSLTAEIEPGTADGRYAVTIVVYYQDDLHIEQKVETSFFIDVSHTAMQTQTTTRATGVVSSVLDYAQYLILLVIVVVVVLLVRRLRKRRSNNALQARRTSKPPT